ncbi:MAG: hypothetical protein ABI574_02100 [Burkholderiales bacterium]
MQDVRQIQLPERFRVVVTLAQLLQRLEGSSHPVDAGQYRVVARRLSEALDEQAQDATNDDDALAAVLRLFPAAADLYENLRYAQAGLCLAPLERSLGTEMEARSVIERAARTSAA